MSATAVTVGTVTTLTGAAGESAIAQNQVTTAAPTAMVGFSFETTRSAVVFRVGSASGLNDIVADAVFLPGHHIISFTPGVSPYFIQFELKGVGIATVEDFTRLTGAILELPTPWTAAEVPQLQMTQSLNTVWFAGAGKEMYVLERRGSSSWSIRPYLQVDGPFGPLNLSDISLTPAARTGTTTLTASAALFTALDVGALVRITHAGQFVTEDLSGVDQVTEPIEVSGVGASRIFQYEVTGTFVGNNVLERSIGNTVNWTTVFSNASPTSNSLNDGLDNQIVYYRWRMSAFTSGAAVASLSYSGGVTDGIARIVTVTADNLVTVDVIRPFGLTSASTLWNIGAWSGRFGHPTAVTLYDGRLWVARGNQYWGSVSDDFSSFDVGPLPAQAISRSFGGRMSSTRWLLGADGLFAGLSGFEAEISSNSFDEVLLPENVKSRGKTKKGSAQAIPALVDDAAVFISRSLERIYRMGPGEGGISVDDLTRINQEIGGVGGFVELAWQDEPEPRLWAVRADGQCGVLVFNPVEGVMAWCRMVTDGFVESVCVTPGTPEDQVKFIIRRTLGETTVRYIEKLAPEAWTDVEDAWRLHCGLEYSGTATTSFTGLNHLNGRTDVYVWANGQQAGPLEVTGNALTLPFEATYAIAGLLYEGKYKSGRLAWGAQMGSALTAEKQLERVGLVIYQTAGGALKWGPDFDDMEQLDDRQSGTLTFDSAVQLWNGDEDFPVHSWTEPDVRLHITMPTAGPATVLALVNTMKVNG